MQAHPKNIGPPLPKNFFDNGGTVANGIKSMRIIADGVAASGAPTQSDSSGGDKGLITTVRDCLAIDIIAKCTGTGSSYIINIWWWYASAGLWVLDGDIGDQAVTTAAGPTSFPIMGLPNFATADGFFIETKTFVNGEINGVFADVWAQGRVA